MASTYVNDLRLEEMATGDQSGTWGDTTNTNLELIAEAFSYGTQASFGSDADATTTIADGASDPARSLYLKVTSGVSLTATRTLTIAPNTVSKVWIIENATSGSQSISISQGSGANVTIPSGDVKVIYTDGAGSGAAVVDAFTDLNLSGTTTVAALDAGSGAITTTGTVTGNNLAGTLTTAAQPNITSVGTLTALTVDDITINGSTISDSGDLTIDTEADLTLTALSDIIHQTTSTNSTAGHHIFKSFNTEIMRIDGGNNSVGIGTTATDGMLTIKKTGSNIFGDSAITIQSADTNQSTLALGLTGSVAYVDSTESGSGTVLPLAFATGSTERMRIDSSGNVGIGTTSPADKLHVYAATGDVGITIETGEDNGAREPSLNLKSYATNANPVINFGDRIGYAGFIEYENQDDSMRFGTATTERMRIDSSGNVGITAAASLRFNGAGDNTHAVGYDSTVDGSFMRGQLGMRFLTGTGGGSERMRIDSNGNIAIGGTSASNFSGYVTLDLRDTTGGLIDFSEASAGVFARIQAVVNNSLNINNRQAYPVTFGTNDTERMRIDSSGTLAIGGTNASPQSGENIAYHLASDGYALYSGVNATTARNHAVFGNPNGYIGSITTNGSATAYNTSSDARLKDVTGKARGLEVINELNPVAYNWKEDGKADEGLIAQEVLDIVPNAVSGSEEDMYQMDYSKLVVHLVAGMKEQQAQIDALQSEINLLKGE
jgi:hypothetical protein